jgi:anaerobic magnesium-protoporphyrin IX monomethyl ester cyclase
MHTALKTVLILVPPVWPNLPPLGMAFLQSYLAQFRWQVDLFDLNNYFYNLADPALKKEWLKSCNKNLEKDMFFLIRSVHSQELGHVLHRLVRYDIIGFSCFKSNLTTTLSLIKLIKALGPRTQIILGGQETARLYYKEKGLIPKIISDLADFVVVGEGELPLQKFLAGLTNSRLALFEQLPHLKALGLPTYRGLDINSYPKRKTLPIQFSRGCIRNCNFCSECLLYKGLRTRPVKDITDEIEFHKNNNGIEYFVFYDSLINADLHKLEQLCHAIINRFGKINWEAQLAIRPEMSESLLMTVKQSGCYNLFVGLESGSDSVLRRMNKGYTGAQATSFF